MTTKGITFEAATIPEHTVVLSSLGVGDTFRLPDVSFEIATGSDESAGAHFYRVLKENKDGLVEVISWDFKNPRKLPKEMLVIEHSVSVKFIRNVTA